MSFCFQLTMRERIDPDSEQVDPIQPFALNRCGVTLCNCRMTAEAPQRIKTSKCIACDTAPPQRFVVEGTLNRREVQVRYRHAVPRPSATAPTLSIADKSSTFDFIADGLWCVTQENESR